MVKTEPVRTVIIEDDPQLVRFLATSLALHGYDAIKAVNARDGLAAVVTAAPGIILLDPGLPDGNGADLVREIRTWSSTPIIVISSCDDVVCKIKALEDGADDYVTKPFDMGELLARMRMAVRRSHSSDSSTVPIFRSGGLVIDLDRHEIRSHGREVHLSPREMDLLRLFVRHPDKLLTSQIVLNEIWGASHARDAHYLRIFVGRIRRKIEPDPARPIYLVTEFGVGYRLRMLSAGGDSEE